MIIVPNTHTGSVSEDAAVREQAELLSASAADLHQ